MNYEMAFIHNTDVDGDFDSNGYAVPVADPAADGWGVFYGTLSRPATLFRLTAKNHSATYAQIRLRIDNIDIGTPATITAAQIRTIDWSINRSPGPVKVELIGGQGLVIMDSSFL